MKNNTTVKVMKYILNSIWVFRFEFQNKILLLKYILK